MTSSMSIVHGGGWLARRIVGRPRARFFGFLSVLWVFVSLGASFPFREGWPETFGRLEWVCLGLMVPQVVVGVLAVVFLLREKPRAFVERHPKSGGPSGKSC